MNVLIVEDEAPAARRLERMVRAHLDKRIETLSLASTLEAARAELASRRTDLLLLDLNLNGADGFSLLEADVRPPTIVVSANSSRAIDAFDHAVIDFVAKPVSAERLAIALDRAIERQAARTPGHASLAVRSAGRIDLAAFADIVSLSGADDYVEVALRDGRRFLHDTRLQELEQRLPPAFLRVHRSHICNTAYIEALTHSGGRGLLQLKGGISLPVSRSRLSAVLDLVRQREGA
jgi:DNA-binding LytR/AlgR family response regulator